MIRLFNNVLAKNSNNIIKYNSPSRLSTTVRSRANKLIIDNIKNGIKHLRIYDEIDLYPADLDWDYLLDEGNIFKIEQNNLNRKGIGNIRKVVSFGANLFSQIEFLVFKKI